MLIPDSPDTFRFGDFELDVGAYALRRNGRPVRIERQPMDLLLLLVERRGQLVLRSEIVDRLWGEDVFVDIETGVNTAIRKVRQALRDSPDAPTFVETVSGKGYRFIAPVEVPGAPRAAPGLAKAQPAASDASDGWSQRGRERQGASRNPEADPEDDSDAIASPLRRPWPIRPSRSSLRRPLAQRSRFAAASRSVWWRWAYWSAFSSGRGRHATRILVPPR